ncbi:MAG: pseudouridine synthase [Desulfovibrio sp.]|nr:pseudouridine synthase [Desulfovibrio sp.]
MTMNGQRLDHASAELLPHLSLRARRRRIENGGVLVNGLPEKAGYRLRPNDTLLLREDAEAATGARLLDIQGEYCFFYKPAGLHTAALSGKSGPSLEDAAKTLLPPEAASDRLQLLGRLDYETSGIVCAALSDKAARDFRRAERAGLCEKRYLALLDGCLRSAVTVRNGLDTANRRKSRLLADTDDETRWTTFLPLQSLPSSGVVSCVTTPEATFALCLIKRGARHQIRAHAAAAGHPLRHDALYGRANQPEASFLLHHAAIHLPGASCVSMPDWPLAAPVASLALRRLAGSI